jgi:hypothetical protein
MTTYKTIYTGNVHLNFCAIGDDVAPDANQPPLKLRPLCAVLIVGRDRALLVLLPSKVRMRLVEFVRNSPVSCSLAARSTVCSFSQFQSQCRTHALIRRSTVDPSTFDRTGSVAVDARHARFVFRIVVRSVEQIRDHFTFALDVDLAATHNSMSVAPKHNLGHILCDVHSTADAERVHSTCYVHRITPNVVCGGGSSLKSNRLRILPNKS